MTPFLFIIADLEFTERFLRYHKLPIDWYEEEYNDIVEELNRKIEAGESE
jgi:hypothetical protein